MSVRPGVRVVIDEADMNIYLDVNFKSNCIILVKAYELYFCGAVGTRDYSVICGVQSLPSIPRRPRSN